MKNFAFLFFIISIGGYSSFSYSSEMSLPACDQLMSLSNDVSAENLDRHIQMCRQQGQKSLSEIQAEFDKIQAESEKNVNSMEEALASDKIEDRKVLLEQNREAISSGSEAMEKCKQQAPALKEKFQNVDSRDYQYSDGFERSYHPQSGQVLSSQRAQVEKLAAQCESASANMESQAKNLDELIATQEKLLGEEGEASEGEEPHMAHAEEGGEHAEEKPEAPHEFCPPSRKPAGYQPLIEFNKDEPPQHISFTEQSSVPKGFLWKPTSESNHKLVVLLPSKFRNTATRVDLYDCESEGEKCSLLEPGSFARDDVNGCRPHYRFSKKGSEYKNVHVMMTQADGQSVLWKVEDGSKRHE